MSENILPMAMNRIDAFRFGTVGLSVAGNEIRLREDDGTVLVRGPGVFEHYGGKAGSTILDAQGFYVTGDLGAIDADGFLTLKGRSSELIKTSTGRRIAPSPIEAALRSVPGVEQAVLFGNGREAPIALCALSGPVDDPTALTLLRERLSAALVQINKRDRPRGIVLLHRPLRVETGELTANLKLRRDAIESQHMESVARLSSLLSRRNQSTGGEDLLLIPS